MRIKGLIATVLVLLIALACPCNAFALGNETEYTVPSKGKTDLAPVGYDTDILEKYVDLDSFKEYIVEEAVNFNPVIDVREYRIPVEDAVIEAMAVIIFKEIPELFHVGSVGYNYTTADNLMVSINLTFIYTKDKYQAMMAECEEAAEEILGDIKATPSLSQAEIALLVHDRLALRCTYDRKLQNDNKFDLYGALIEGLAVCEGYTKSYAYLLEKMGIKSEFCASLELAHAWNIVYIDGQPYHVDVTWDDISVVVGEVFHDNFMLSTEALRKGGSEFFLNAHDAYDFSDIPQDTRYDDYFWRDSYTAFQLIDGEIYYLNSKEQTVNRYTGATPDELYRDDSRWNKYWGCYGRLASDGENLFYSTNTGVSYLDIETHVSYKVYEPQEVAEKGMEVFGFMYDDGYLVCDLSTTNNYFNADVLRVKKFFDPSDIVPPVVPVKATTVSDALVKYYYTAGESLDITGMEIEITYSDGTRKRVSEGLTVLSYDPSATGKQMVSVGYEDIIIDFEIMVCAKGDVNLDGKISVTDATMLQKFVASMVELNEMQQNIAEVNGDGRLSVSDATYIQKYVAGIITEFSK